MSSVARPDAAEAAPRAPYANPYLAGFGLGLVLLATFVVMGRGLGVSGAFNSGVAWLVSLAAPEYAAGNGFLSRYLDGESHPLRSWLVLEVAGLFLGALASGVLAGRVARTVEKGPRVAVRDRLLLAAAGGALVAVGAALARGCTSGQALTGGAQLNLGSWLFMLCVFAGGYAAAGFLRRQWR